ncbi:bifunctional 4-hydroxy-2-oxoglutarate aldolase/2-dehydro-3-deoxy-phosphogluconate aldolase [Virgibacillus siamensis]|uniref:bifunctional 4-hydroxy-2-oxoglutarate aldolase/2-dehydro-3-deoxy-phosphogluconate aldolase n=1 Tax=Virgibacillus siamensis TaxID=480071 RepID=UPI000986CCF8|nr:bifunctional 4-hydroxy-2-oxoglutarate aldolase/2-dehydro-3-deoxy-phosphogluconate aldolase [Virgibacillus siamensis]
MTPMELIMEQKVVAVIRGADKRSIAPILEALSSGGINVVEITAETPNVRGVIETAVKQMGKEMCIGAGTVLDPETAKDMLMAGAEFIVSPVLNTKTLALTNRYNVLNIPGVMTPTEILTAYEHGAKMVKIFPANTFGPHYIKNILGPLPYVKAMVTGGITIENMNDYLAKGAEAVGIGSSLVNAKALETNEDFKQLTAKAKSFVAKLDER